MSLHINVLVRKATFGWQLWPFNPLPQPIHLYPKLPGNERVRLVCQAKSNQVSRWTKLKIDRFLGWGCCGPLLSNARSVRVCKTISRQHKRPWNPSHRQWLCWTPKLKHSRRGGLSAKTFLKKSHTGFWPLLPSFLKAHRQTAESWFASAPSQLLASSWLAGTCQELLFPFLEDGDQVHSPLGSCHFPRLAGVLINYRQRCQDNTWSFFEHPRRQLIWFWREFSESS